MISSKLDRLEAITRRQQAAGTEKLRKAEIAYDDGTIQGVMEHIPAGQGGGGGSDITFATSEDITDITNEFLA